MSIIGSAFRTTWTQSFFLSMSDAGRILTEMDDGWVKVPAVHEPTSTADQV